MPVTFYVDARTFLADAASAIARDPLSAGVITSIAERYEEDSLPAWAWFAIVEHDGVQHLAMRTHPDEPHAGFVTAMPAGAVAVLAEALEARGERVPAWNGNLDGALTLCRRAVPGVEPRIEMHTRMLEIHDVAFPARPAGQMRRATAEDMDLLIDFMLGFKADSEEQGGRPVDPELGPPEKRERVRHAMERRLQHGRYWLWEVDGRPVHLTGAMSAGPGSVRLGPVYTPAEERGRGYAGWVVATVSQQLLDEGNRVSLYTDQANPVSNKVYERIGYQRVVDEGNVSSA